jgi:hypothetical protein
MRTLTLSSLSVLSLVAALAGPARADSCAAVVNDAIKYVNQSPSTNWIEVQISGSAGTQWGSWGQGSLNVGFDSAHGVTALTGGAVTYYSDRTWTPPNGGLLRYPFSPFNTDNIALTIEVRSDGNVWMDTYNDPNLWGTLSCYNSTGNLIANVNGYGAIVTFTKQFTSIPR